MTVSFDVWAPLCRRVRLVADTGEGPSEPVDLERDADDWWRLPAPVAARLGDDADYGYLLDGDENPVPDPRSRFQPHGVHGLSRAVDPDLFNWTDRQWTGRQLAGGVIYELHVGTFTAEGTLDAAIGRLDHLVELGIDFVEVMPVNAFNGEHGWGYDGVGWYAVHHAYGGPRAYQRFVDACHARGLAVIQDVVYNHFGPSGNYAPRFGPYLDDSLSSPWGAGVNLSGPGSDPVRRFIIDNALMWLRDYHVDGLRLDAVHALVDTRAVHLLEELADEVEALSAFERRPLSLVAESDQNDPRLITSRDGGGYGLTAQWSDDFHHALVTNLTGDATGYYADFAGLGALAKVLEEGFFHNGTHSSFRGRRHGRRLDTATIPASRLVVCSDNHDQIGNRADGARLSTRLGVPQLRIAAALTLLNGSTPMVFMGQEWAASTPWAFFSSHPEPELGAAITEGRLREFAGMAWDHAQVPDPQDPETFERSKLRWSEIDGGDHAELWRTYRDLIELRRRYLDLVDPRFDHTSTRYSEDDHWLVLERGRGMALVVNFGAARVEVPMDAAVEPVYAIGTASCTGGDAPTVRLGGHSAAVVRVG
ncbi:MAG TPA: malto-oligosyltrehalose trehalohydrolase [Propionibacteriaceae bacterium]|nr:malto-oligosyltrehalose trehalohydrolase [Propionibacteriaceae bacterium]